MSSGHGLRCCQVRHHLRPKTLQVLLQISMSARPPLRSFHLSSRRTSICSVFLRVAVVTFEAPLQDLQRVVGVDDLEIDGTDLFPHSSPAGSRFQHSGTSMSSTALRLPRSYVSTVLTGRLKGFPPMCRQWNSFTPEVSLLFSFTLFPAGSS